MVARESWRIATRWIQLLGAKVTSFVLKPICWLTLTLIPQSDQARKTSRLAQPSPREPGNSNTVNTEDKHDLGNNPLNQSPDSSLGLAPLLDFSTLTTAEEISERFEAVAQELLCNTILSVVQNGTCTDLDILELEFYLQKSSCHEDPFTHGSVEQERSGQW